MPFQGSFPKHTVYYSVGWKWLSTVVVLKFFSEAFSISLLFNEKALGRLIKSQIHPTCEFKLTYYKLCTDFPRKYPSKNLLAAMWPPKFVRKWIRVRKQQQQLIKKKKKKPFAKCSQTTHSIILQWVLSHSKYKELKAFDLLFLRQVLPVEFSLESFYLSPQSAGITMCATMPSNP